MNSTQKIQDLEKKVSMLSEEVARLSGILSEKQVQQINFPLDRASAQIISKALGL